MSHESVWNSRPRTYGKGAREWYVCLPDHFRFRNWKQRTNTRELKAEEREIARHCDLKGKSWASADELRTAASAHTRLVSSESTALTSAVNASVKRPPILDLSRYANRNSASTRTPLISICSTVKASAKWQDSSSIRFARMGCGTSISFYTWHGV